MPWYRFDISQITYKCLKCRAKYFEAPFGLGLLQENREREDPAYKILTVHLHSLSTPSLLYRQSFIPTARFKDCFICTNATEERHALYKATLSWVF